MGGSPLRYNLEDLTITDLNKIRLLVFILILTCVLAIIAATKERIIQSKRKFIKAKNGTTLYHFSDYDNYY